MSSEQSLIHDLITLFKTSRLLGLSQDALRCYEEQTRINKNDMQNLPRTPKLGVFGKVLSEFLIVGNVPMGH